MPEIAYGLCQCGCGGKAPLAKQAIKLYGLAKGQPKRFINGHHLRLALGPKTHGWKGGRYTSKEGYVKVAKPGHPRASKCGSYVPEHVLIVEAAIGRFLKDEEEVHHKDEDKANNVLENLQLCYSRFHHKMEHRWLDARKACGNENWRKCMYCKQWGPENEVVACRPNRKRFASGHHIKCRSAHDIKKYHENMQAARSSRSLPVDAEPLASEASKLLPESPSPAVVSPSLSA